MGRLVPVSLQPPVRLPSLKRAVLASHEGAVPLVDDIVRQAAWDEPLVMPAGTELVIPQVLREAELLGLLAFGTLSDAGRALLTTRPRADLGVARWFPPPVEDLVLQADLTAVVPGRTRKAALVRRMVTDAGENFTPRPFSLRSRRAQDAPS